MNRDVKITIADSNCDNWELILPSGHMLGILLADKEHSNCQLFHIAY